MAETILGGRYRLDAQLGEGGMAVVYRGFDLYLGRQVAVKLLREPFASQPEFVGRFEAEARSSAALTHPNIASIYDVGTSDAGHGLPSVRYIVMELVEGEGLNTLLGRSGPLSPDRVVAVGIEIADALAYAHGRGLVHGDVKPRNILVMAGERVKVVDFGLAVAMGAPETISGGAVLGSGPYMSPEQAAGEPLSPASDVYSLGLVLYEMATGRRPANTGTAPAQDGGMGSGLPPAPSTLNPLLPAGLDAIILRALTPMPSERYRSAAELRDALRGYRRGADDATTVHPAVPRAARPSPETTQVYRPSTREPIPYPKPSRAAQEPRWPWVLVLLFLAGAAAMLTLTWSSLQGLAQPANGTLPPASDIAEDVADRLGDAASNALAAATSQPTPAEQKAVPVPSPTRLPAPAANATPVPATATAVRPTATVSPPTATAVPASRPTAAPEGPLVSVLPASAGRPLREAVAVVESKGYVVPDTGSYDEDEQLRVLIGVSPTAPAQADQRAFFFRGERYLGTDLASPSGRLTFLGQDGDTVTLAYGMYRPEDPPGAPSGGSMGVRYRWDGTRLRPLDPLPTDDPEAPLSRR